MCTYSIATDVGVNEAMLLSFLALNKINNLHLFVTHQSSTVIIHPKIMNHPCLNISMQNAGSLYNAVLLNISWNLQRKLEVNNTQKRKFIALDGCHSIPRWILRKLRIDGEDPAAIYDKNHDVSITVRWV